MAGNVPNLENMKAEDCGACGKPLLGAMSMSGAGRKKYHMECFRCGQCNATLGMGSAYYLGVDGRPNCAKHMARAQASAPGQAKHQGELVCEGCGEAIVSSYRKVFTGYYHSDRDCLKCSKCAKSMTKYSKGSAGTAVCMECATAEATANVQRTTTTRKIDSKTAKKEEKERQKAEKEAARKEKEEEKAAAREQNGSAGRRGWSLFGKKKS